MIRITSFIAFFITVATHVFAQTPVPESVFPIGGFGFGYYDSTKTNPVMRDGKFNSLFNADPKLIHHLGTNKNGYPEYQNGYLRKYVGGKYADWHCSDMRFFLTSFDVTNTVGNRPPITRKALHNTSSPNYKPYAYDLLRSWKRTTGGVVGNEWSVTFAQNPIDGIILDTLQVSLSRLDDFGVDNDVDRRSYFINTELPYDSSDRLAICDFSYRIDTIGISDYHHPTTVESDNLYEIEYTVIRAKGSDHQHTDFGTRVADAPISVFITKGDFKNKGGDVSLWNSDHIRFKNFDGKQYAFNRTSINIEPRSTDSGMYYPVQIECRLKTTAKSFGIFIRGLRVRSVDGDKLLRGTLNDSLNAMFKKIYYDIRKNATSDSVASWSKIPAITGGGESSSPSWRALAYIENKWRKYCKDSLEGHKEKRIYTFMAENTYVSRYAWYRAIYEDETGNVPPPVFPECDGLSGLGLDRPFRSFPSGYPRDFIPRARQTSVPDFTLFSTPIQDYATYTTNYQGAFDLFCMRRSEKDAAFPPDGSRGKWIALLNCRQDYRLEGVQPFTIRADSIRIDGTKPLYQYIKEQMHLGKCQDKEWKPIRFSEVADTNRTAYNNVVSGNWNNQYRTVSRSLTANELRADAWHAICFGAQGILWNTLGSDMIENVGLVDGTYGRKHDWWDEDTTDGMKPIVSFTLDQTCKYPVVPENRWDFFYVKKLSSPDLDWYKIPVGHSSIASIVGASPISKSYNETAIISRLNNTTDGWIVTNPLSSGETWAPVMVGDDCRSLSGSDTVGLDTAEWNKNIRWAAFFDSTGCAPLNYENNYRWPYRNMSAQVWIPTYYGFKERFGGAKTVSNDILPIAKLLSELTWKEAAMYDMLRDSGFMNFPLRSFEVSGTDKTSQRVSPFAYDTSSSDRYTSIAQFDSQSDTATRNKPLILFGRFEHPSVNDSAIYVSFMNKRTWVVRYEHNDLLDPEKRTGIQTIDNGTDSLLGAVDVRRFNFKVNPDGFFDTTVFKIYTIKDMRTGREKVVTMNDTMSFILEPGEGTLVRIAPAMGLALGQASDNLFNNGRHIAAIETSMGAVTQYVTTYQRNGNIVISFPVETPSGDSKREAGTPIDTVIDNSGKCFNPAVAYKQDRDLIGITYRKVLAGNGPTVHDTILILYRTANYTLPRVYSAPVKVDSFIAPKGYLSPPAIAPKMGIDGNNFWVAYNHPDSGGVLVLMDIPKTVPPPLKRYFWGSVRAHVKFVSIATHLPTDTCHVAFEEGATDEDGHIWYMKGYISPITGGIVRTETTCISHPSDICINHNPQIAFSDYVRVTWEGVRKRCVEEACVNSTYDHFAMTRMRLGRNTWDAFDVFHTLERVEQLSSEPYTPRIFPNIIMGSSIAVQPDKHNPDTWFDFARLTWSNPLTGNIDIVRNGYNGHFDYSLWGHFSYVEESQQPAMPTLSRGINATHPFTYLHPLESSTLDQLRIVRYDFPKNNIEEEPRNWEKIIANPFAFQGCNRQIKQTLGDIMLKNVVDVESPIAFAISSDSLRNDYDYAPISWNDKRLRTVNFPIVANDTLLYQRFFQVGDFQAGDTTAVSDSLRNIFDFITGRIYLRQASNDSILAILDTCKLTKYGFVQSADGGSLKTYPLPMSSDSVYMSMEMIRGNDTNGFTISVMHVRGEDTYAGYIPTAGAFKKSDPSVLPSTGKVESTPLTLSVTPNPFESSTRLIVQTVKDIPLTIEVYNVLGGLVIGLYNGISSEEQYEFTLDNRVIRPGTYFVRAKAGNAIVTRKIQFVK